MEPTAGSPTARFIRLRKPTWLPRSSSSAWTREKTDSRTTGPCLSKTTDLDAAQLDALANSRQGVYLPVAYYSFEAPDTTADGLATDYSGHHRDGTLSAYGTGSYSYAASAPAVLAGTQSLRLDEAGTAELHNAARLTLDLSASELDFSNDSWTFAGWYNRADIDSNDFIFHLGKRRWIRRRQ